MDTKLIVKYNELLADWERKLKCVSCYFGAIFPETIKDYLGGNRSANLVILQRADVLSDDLKSVTEDNSQLLSRLSPVLHGLCPLAADARISQINKLLQSRIIRKHTLVFGYFAQLAVIALDRIGGIYNPPNRRCIIKISR